jgi:nitroreductase
MSEIATALRKIIPEPIKAVLRPAQRFFHMLIGPRRHLRQTLWHNFEYDAVRFWRHAALVRNNLSQANLRALLTMDSHRIEKGLTLSNPRQWFGKEAVGALLTNLREYLSCFGPDETTTIAVDSLSAYYRFHVAQGLDDELLLAQVRELDGTGQQGECVSERGGVLPITRTEIHAAGKIDLRHFLATRHSIRHFDSKSVDQNLISQAVAMAITTPSVCNRQAWKVYVFRDKVQKQEILFLQDGNRGFREEIDVLLVVTCDLQCFASVGERNQAWIDGGMFSMSLVLALHSLGLGTCCLNWSVTKEVDEQLRAMIALSESEVIVMFIAVGHIPKTLTVARSTRKLLDEVMVVKSSGNEVQHRGVSSRRFILGRAQQE